MDVTNRFVNHYPRNERKGRKEVKRLLRNKGIKTARPSYLTCVETTAIDIPGWARSKRFTPMSSSARMVWFKGKSSVHARMLIFEDRRAGGKPETTRVEYRMCKVCGRVLLALEAEMRRRLDESDQDGRKLPCTGDCKK